MSGHRHTDIELFEETFQLSPPERIAFLDRACAGHSDQRRRIEALLKSNDRVGNFLEKPPTLAISEGRARIAAGEAPGDQIGRYKLLQEIGEGGCGVVFLAEQEEPIHRRVALKVIKPGMDTKSVIARFEAERQALAMMDHPNIAHVLDAGATAGGRPYFVMEFVEGVKITDYCDRHSLSTGARLQLFIQVCDAIQHAHQKGIIHRDIKPSNILVTTGSDGKPAPKVIDFGIAKATTGQRLTDNTVFTECEMLMGTPAYMSPEQAALTNADVDTRTDIYSLGILLYELLTGTTPFDTRELLKAGLDEVRRVIRDEEPIRPSARLSTTIATDSANGSKRHGLDAPKLIREMRGDLDWIVMNALEKERARRYATANALAMDIKRYLSGEAVLARPPSTRYKARKLIGRNKMLCSGLAIIFLLLGGGLSVTIRLLIVERQRRERIEHQNEVYKLEGLALAAWTQGKSKEAVNIFRQSFEFRKQFLPTERPSTIAVASLVDLLQKNNKDEEAAKLLFVEYRDTESETMPAYLNLFTKVASSLAMKGRWLEAVGCIVRALEAKPDLPDYYHLAVPLLVVSGKDSEYRQLCQQIVLRFADTEDILVADQMAKDCLILPSSGVDLTIVGAMADLAVRRGTNQPSYSLFQCCKALAEYRQGNFTEAKEWAALAVKHSFAYSKAEGYAILAMAQFESDKTDEARAALAECAKVINEKLPKLSSGNLGNDWRDWIIAHALHKEADALINQKGP